MIEVLLSKLEGVKRQHRGKHAEHWIAKCPGHEDRSPSLSIALTHDGTILLHDFGGCETSRVLQSINLAMADLLPWDDVRRMTPKQRREFERTLPPTERKQRQRERKAWAWEAAIKHLTHDLLAVELAARDIANYRQPSKSDLAVVQRACDRIHDARRQLA